MSVTVNLTVQRRMWGGLSSPFPSGVWISAGAVTGDATGGVRQLSMLFNEQPSWSELISLEQYSTFDDEQTNQRDVLIHAAGFDNEIPNGIRQRWVIPMFQAANEQSISPSELHGLFLGGQAIPTVSTSLLWEINNSDGNVFEVVAQGYIWTAEARSIPGGPQIPVTSLFRR